MNRVPNLRFPEFSGEWEEKRLGELSDRIGDGIHSTPIYTEISKYYFINGNNLSDKKIVINKNTKMVDEVEFFKHFIELTSQTILMSINGTIGNLGYYNNERVILGKSSAYINLKDFIPKEYIYNFLQTSKVKNYFDGELTGSTIKNLSLATLRNTPINFPSLPEQQEIASFLSSVDSKIEKLERKKELWEQYKKGMMQKIFSQELRFKPTPSSASSLCSGRENGEEYPEWEEKKFGSIYSFKSTNSYSRDNLNYEYGEVKNIHYGDIHIKFKTLFDINVENVPFINQDISLDKVSLENYCQNGDLVIADASEDYADIGKSIEITNIDNQKILAGLHTFLARPTPNIIALGFGGYLMKSPKLHSKIKVIAQGTKVLSLSSTRVSELKIDVPSLLEQTQVANFLSSIDSKIEIVSKELTGMKEFKKGLLQQMFV